MKQFAYLGRRLAHLVPVLIVITFAMFLLFRITPGDPALAVAGPRAGPERLAEVRKELGLDQDVGTQYVKYLGQLMQGDLGQSNKGGTPVTTLIGERWAVTAWIVTLGSLLALMISIPLGSWAAVKRDRRPDVVIRAGTAVGLAMPMFWFGLMLVIVVARPTGWFPVGGQFGDTFGSRFRATFLPALTLAIALAPVLVRSLRASMVSVLDSDYITASRAIGADGVGLVSNHVMRNAAVPVVSLLAVQVGYLLFGTVLVEQTFDLHGLGEAMIVAARDRDYPVVVGLTVVFAIGVVLVHLAADVVVGILDPRVRLQ